MVIAILVAYASNFEVMRMRTLKILTFYFNFWHVAKTELRCLVLKIRVWSILTVAFVIRFLTKVKLTKAKLLLFFFDTRFQFVGSLTTAFMAVEFWAVKTGGDFLFLHTISFPH